MLIQNLWDEQMNESTSSDVNLCSTDLQYNLIGTTGLGGMILLL